ncbi:hypothetical protein PUN28_009363 [Cardiocondyla obscurior]|uniref:Uncharacterized protein n=1 Tax=Cardiocondyla obscurior TaxID=286306 RepID=A0AAW2FX80_9HYME
MVTKSIIVSCTIFHSYVFTYSLEGTDMLYKIQHTNTKASSHSMHTHAKYFILNYARKRAFNPLTPENNIRTKLTTADCFYDVCIRIGHFLNHFRAMTKKLIINLNVIIIIFLFKMILVTLHHKVIKYKYYVYM